MTTRPMGPPCIDESPPRFFGGDPPKRRRTCPSCDGTGYQLKLSGGSRSRPITRARCIMCQGSGKVSHA